MLAKFAPFIQQLSDQALICFQHFQYLLSYVGIFLMISYKNSRPERNSVDYFHRSRRPTLKPFTKDLHRKSKPTILQGIYSRLF